MSSADSTRSVLLFAGGVAIGSALAFGAAYGLATYYQNRVDDAANRSARRGAKSSDLVRTRSVGTSKTPAPRTSTSPPPPAANGTKLHAPTPRVAPAFEYSLITQDRDPSPARAHSINPLVASPRVTALVRNELQDGAYDIHVYDEAPSARETHNELSDNMLRDMQSAMGTSAAAHNPAGTSYAGSALAGAPAGPPSTQRMKAGSGSANSAGMPPKAGFFHSVPPADRSNKAAMEVIKHNANVVASASGGMAHSGSSGNLQAMLQAQPQAHNTATQLPALPTLQMPMHSGAHDSKEMNSQDSEYCRVITPEAPMNDETEEVCAMLAECMEMRKKWLFQPSQVRTAAWSSWTRSWCPTPTLTPEFRRGEPEAATPHDVDPNPLEYRPLPPSGHVFRMVDGVMRVYTHSPDGGLHECFPVPGSASDLFADMHRILRYGALGPVKSFCHHRLMLLEQKFNLHVMLNADKEFLAQKVAPHRDFYNVRKVDTHIHHSACMHQKHLLRFIKSKLRKEPDEVVIFRDGKYLTLKEVFESLNMTGYDLNVDTLDMHADKSLFHRFDKFNLKYNPCGQSRLREIFIKQDNLIHGRFLAELTKEVFSDLEASKYQHAELRISIYGRKAMEWDILASWVVANELYSDNNVWLIQIPRLYNIYKETGVIENFQEMLDNIFEPLFEVTRDPSTHPQLHVLLSQVVGFDMVDDESKPERRPTKHSPPPADWNSKHNCAYSYYSYYIYANLYTLNKLREARGLNTFAFRPHSGEAGDIDHLVSTFMLCENIAHGINLRKSPCLQYLYYLAQIGLCMSPLSNNSLFLDYHRNPFPTFFARGLSVSLSTDDPLQIHLTKEPLVEEYSVAAQVWKMSSADLCEIARNGVLHSGFPHACKKHWVGEYYWRPGPEGNDIHKTNVPNLRLKFRYDTYMDEMRLVAHGATAYQAKQESKKKASGN